MPLDKITVIKRPIHPSLSDQNLISTATVIITLRKLELSQQSQDKLKKLLTKLLLDPKKVLIRLEEENFIGKAGVISNIEVQRNFSLMQENRNYLWNINNYLWNITNYHATQSSFNSTLTENDLLDLYLKNFCEKFPKKSKNFFNKLIFEYLISSSPLP